MKKIIILFASLAICLSSFAGGQGEDNGLGLKVYGGFGEQFGIELKNKAEIKGMSDLYKAKPQIGLSLDNRWYFLNPAFMGLALNARWVDFSYDKADYKMQGADFFSQIPSIDEDYLTYDVNNFSIDALNLGLIFTIYFNDLLALDAFYNIGPSILIQNIDISDKLENAIENNLDGVAEEKVEDAIDKFNPYPDNLFAFGVNHKAGLALRIGIFQIGAEAKLGKAKIMDWGFEDEGKSFARFENHQSKLNSLRAFIGFKF
jgi:hypothetical protein